MAQLSHLLFLSFSISSFCLIWTYFFIIWIEVSQTEKGGVIQYCFSNFTALWRHLLLPFYSVQFSRLAVSDTLQPHGWQHARLPCPSPTPRVYSNSCRLSQWCHPAISSSVFPFSLCLQSFPESRSFPMSQFFTSGGQSIWTSASASALPMNIQN